MHEIRVIKGEILEDILDNDDDEEKEGVLEETKKIGMDFCGGVHEDGEVAGNQMDEGRKTG